MRLAGTTMKKDGDNGYNGTQNVSFKGGGNI